MKSILLGAEAFDRFAEIFASSGLEPVRIPPDERLNDLVSSHADTHVFACGNAALINCELAERIGLQTKELPDTEDAAHPRANTSEAVEKHPDADARKRAAQNVTNRRSAQKSIDINETLHEASPHDRTFQNAHKKAAGLYASRDFPYGDYPSDTRFNALSFCGRVYGRTASLSPDVLSLAALMGAVPVNVKQGYARCAVLPLEAAGRAVTADKGLAAALRANGADVLLIAPSSIQLGKRTDGFIGGASAVDEETRRVWLFGQADSIPDGGSIRDFIHESGYTLIEGGGKLTDLGGGVILDAQKAYRSKHDSIFESVAESSTHRESASALRKNS